MARDYRADFNLLAVSAASKETAINTEQTLSHTMLVSKGDIIHLDPRRESNRGELTGYLEPDMVYDLGALASVGMNFEKAQAQHFAFGLSYGLGVSTPSAWSTGYKHTITRASGVTPPTFTAAQRLGLTLAKRRFASLAVESLSAVFAKDSWAKLTVNAKGTGKYASTITKENITQAYNSTSLVLAANAVQGSTAAARLDSVHAIRCQVPATLEWVDVAFSSVSSASPAIIVITAPGVAATSTTFQVIYSPTEPAWATFPARVDESPLRVTDLVVNVGGKWNGSAFAGGHAMSAEIESIEYNLATGLQVEYRPGGTGTYANMVQYGEIAQTIKLSRQARDWILQQHIVDNDYFGVSMTATGALFEAAHNYFVTLVFPRCNVLTAPISVSDRIIAEAGDLVVLEDSTYGSVWAQVGNMVAAYTA